MKVPRANALGTFPNLPRLSGTFNHEFPSCHGISYNNSNSNYNSDGCGDDDIDDIDDNERKYQHDESKVKDRLTFHKLRIKQSDSTESLVTRSGLKK